MAHSGDGGLLRAEPMTMASEPFPMGERRWLPKWLAMNSRLPKQMVSLSENPSYDRHSPSAVTASADDGTIRTSRGKLCYKLSYLACQLSVFFPPTRYMVFKIAHSCSEVVLRTTKYTMIYLGSGPSLEVIALCPTF
jgi:hypothetical protein